MLKVLPSILENVSINLQQNFLMSLLLHLQWMGGLISPWIETQKTLKTVSPFTTQFKKYFIMQIHSINPLLTQCGIDVTLT